MPYYRKKRITYRRRRPILRCKLMMKRRGYRRSRISNINKVPIRYSSEQALGNISVVSGTSFTGAAYSIYLAGFLPNYSEFSAMFDQYRLRTILMKFRLVAPPEANNTPLTLQYYPDIICTVDHDDANTPADMATLRQYGKSKFGILKPNYWFTYRCHPTANFQVYRSAVTTAYAPANSRVWIDIAQNDVPFYGVKVGVDVSSMGTLASLLSVEVRAYCTWEFKNTR